jgi:hypothetical protein
LYAFLILAMRSTCSVHLILLGLITLIILVKRTSYEAPHYAVFCSFPPLPPSYLQIFFSASWSQPPNLCSLRVRDQASHPYTTRCKMTVFPTFHNCVRFLEHSLSSVVIS